MAGMNKLFIVVYRGCRSFLRLFFARFNIVVRSNQAVYRHIHVFWHFSCINFVYATQAMRYKYEIIL